MTDLSAQPFWRSADTQKLLLSSSVCSFARAAVTKDHRPGAFDNRIVLPYRSRGWEFKTKGSAGSAPSEGREGSCCSRPSPGLTAGHLSLCLHTVFPLCVFLCPNFPFLWDIGHTGLGPTLTASFQLDHLCFKFGPALRYEGLELQHMNLRWGGHSSTHHRSIGHLAWPEAPR